MQKEEISAAPRMLDGLLNELGDGLRLELGIRAKGKGSLILLDAHMSHTVVQLEAQGEDVMVVGAVAHDEGAVRFAG